MKKTLCLLLAALLVASCLSFAAAEEEVTIRAIMRLPATFVVEDNPVIEAWGQRTGVRLEVEAPPISNYNERLNIVMASDDLPDLIFVMSLDSTYQQWARDGLLLDLTEYFTPEKMPNACNVLTDSEIAGCKVDDVLYSLPRCQAKPNDCIIYRGDWLEKLGLSVPTTAEEFAAVMEAFATQDPDGNGLNDTYGFSVRDIEDRNLVHGFGIRPSCVPDENGEYTLMQGQPGYMEELTWLRDMYQNGSLDPEWYLNQSYEDTDKFYAGKIGAHYATSTINHVISMFTNEAFQAANPDGYVVAGPALMPAGAETVGIYYPPQVWGAYAVNAESKYIDKVIALLDDGYTDECVTLCFKGIEGLTYTSLDPETRVISVTEEQNELAAVYTSSYLTVNYQLQNKGLIIAGGTSTNEDELNAWLEADAYIAQKEYRIPYLGQGTIPGMSDENTRLTNDGVFSEFSEMRTKYICGQISAEEMEAYIRDKYVPANEGVMKLIRESGINQ